MSEVTKILGAIENGDGQAADQLLPLVYDELRKLASQRMAQEKPGHTLQTTGLVHEAYIRLVDIDKTQDWNSRGHFFAAAAEAMRRILVDSARKNGRSDRRSGRPSKRLDFSSTVEIEGDSCSLPRQLLWHSRIPCETSIRTDDWTANTFCIRKFDPSRVFYRWASLLTF